VWRLNRQKTKFQSVWGTLFSGKGHNKWEINGRCFVTLHLALSHLSCSAAIFEIILPANKYSRSWSVQNQALPKTQTSLSKIHRRNSADGNSRPHNHTKRGLPEWFPAMAGLLEQECMCRRAVHLRVTMLGYIHVIFIKKLCLWSGNFLSSHVQHVLSQNGTTLALLKLRTSHVACVIYKGQHRVHQTLKTVAAQWTYCLRAKGTL